MKKIIFGIIFLFVLAFNINAQDYGYYDGGMSVRYTVTLDSNATSTTSNYIDWSIFDGQTIYATYSLVQNNYGFTAGHDTIAIHLLGQDGLGNVIRIDTIGSRIVSNTTQALASGQATLSLSGYAPQVAFYVKPLVTGANTKNGGKAVLKITLYSPTLDVLPPKEKMFWY